MPAQRVLTSLGRVAGMVVVACTNGVGHATTQASTQQGAWDVGAVVIHAYTEDVGGIRAVGANVRLRVGRDLALAGEPVLLVEYPAATNDPAARDVYVEAEHQDWSAARAIGFRVKPVHGIRLSVSFVDRNQVVYTAWTQLRGGVWQSVRIPFQGIHPNPYFQPPVPRLEHHSTLDWWAGSVSLRTIRPPGNWRSANLCCSPRPTRLVVELTADGPPILPRAR